MPAFPLQNRPLGMSERGRFRCAIALCRHRGTNLAGPSSLEGVQAPLELSVTELSVTEQTEPYLNC